MSSYPEILTVASSGGGKVENMDEGDRENGKKPLVYLVWAHDWQLGCGA